MRITERSCSGTVSVGSGFGDGEALASRAGVEVWKGREGDAR